MGYQNKRGVRPRNVDRNQSALVRELRSIPGVSVEPSLSQLGHGVPDLLVACRDVNILFEVKNPDQKPSARKLTEDEREWHQNWNGPVYVVENLEDVRLAFLVLGVELFSS